MMVLFLLGSGRAFLYGFTYTGSFFSPFSGFCVSSLFLSGTPVTCLSQCMLDPKLHTPVMDFHNWGLLL